MMEMIEWGQKSKPRKIPRFPTKPKKIPGTKINLQKIPWRISGAIKNSRKA